MYIRVSEKNLIICNIEIAKETEPTFDAFLFAIYKLNTSPMQRKNIWEIIICERVKKGEKPAEK